MDEEGGDGWGGGWGEGGGFEDGMQQMFGGEGGSEYTEDIEEGGAVGKLGSALGGMCLGILLFPVALLILGWNENHYVCEDRRILFAEAKATEVGCDASNVFDTFAFFSCPLDPASLTKFEPCNFNPGMQCDDSLSFRSVAGRQLVEMYQCVESCSERKEKNSLGQNRKVRTCDYSMEWKSREVYGQGFHQDPHLVASSCPAFGIVHGNPSSPGNLEMGETSDAAQTVRTLPPGGKGIGYQLNHRLTEDLTPDTQVKLQQFRANFSGTGTFIQGSGPWTRPMQVSPSNLFVSGDYLMTCAEPYQLGCVRISYYDSDTTAPTVITQVTNDGETRPASLPGSWGCSPTSWQAVDKHSYDKTEMIGALRDANYMSVWIIRLVGCLLACIAVCCCLAPISAVADIIGDWINCLPCGGFVEDFIEGLVDQLICIVGCNIGLACSFLVIATVWVAMRPLVGGALLVLSLLCCCAAVGAKQAFGAVKDGCE